MSERTALWVTPVSDLGGVARHLLDVAETGIPGWRTVFLVPPGPLVARLRDAGAAVVDEPFGDQRHPLGAWSALRRAVRTVRPAIVHSHLAHADLVAASAWRRGPRRVSTEHGIAGDASLYARSRLEARAMQLAHHARLRRTDALIAVADATRRTIGDRWHPPASLPVHVVHNGIDPVEVDRDRSPGPLRISTMSRLAPEKGLEDALEAFAVVSERCDAVLTMAGDGPLRDRLERRASTIGVADRVRFVGHVDAGELLATTDVLLALSRWENCSYSVLDACREGCGVVTTDVGGNPELVPPRCLVPVGDVAGAAAAVVAQAEPGARPGLPEAWPTRAAMCASIAEVYEKLVA